MTVLTELEQLTRAQSFDFVLKYYVGTPYPSPSWSDVTSKVLGLQRFWYGYRSDNVVGWDASVELDEVDASTFVAGKAFKITRSFTSPGIAGSGLAEAEIVEGTIMPYNSSQRYADERMILVITDHPNYLMRTQAPILAAGANNLAVGSTASADSENEPLNVSDEGEFKGLPPLSGGQSIDSNMNTLWISQKAPTMSDITWSCPASAGTVLNEVYVNPADGLDRAKNQWFEIIRSNDLDVSRTIRLMTKAGIIAVEDVTFAPKDPDGDNDGFAIITYGDEYYSLQWGDASNVPVFYFKNWRAKADKQHTVDAVNFNFNNDGNGDFIAISADTDSADDHRWRTEYVVAGSDMANPLGTVVITGWDSTNEEWLEFTAGRDIGLNELAGWFVAQASGASAVSSAMRQILTNTAATSGNTCRITFNEWVDDSMLQVGMDVTIYPWPYSVFVDYRWTTGSTPLAAEPLQSTSDRRSEDGLFSDPRQNAWIEDESPAPGYSGAPPDASGWAWVSVLVRTFSAILTNAVENGDTVVYVDTTDGFTSTGQIKIGGAAAVSYTAKGVNSFTLTSAWSGGTEFPDTVVYQYESSANTDVWKLSHMVMRRRDVPGYDDRPRVPEYWRLFATSIISPRYPGETDWRDDWDYLGGSNTNTNTRFSFQLATKTRYRHVLFAIKQMTDESFGRLNEFEIYADEDTITSSLTEESSVASVFRYLATAMGVQDTDVQTADASIAPIGHFGTDGSEYMAVFDDFANRYGQLIWSGPQLFRFRCSTDIDYPGGVAPDPEANLDDRHYQSYDYRAGDDYTISQVQVTVKDDEGNTRVGYYPLRPRSSGNPYQDTNIYSAPLDRANDIAMRVYRRMTADTLSLALTGPATWIRPGFHRIDVAPPGSSGYLPYIVTALEHVVNHGSKYVPRSFQTRIELRRIYL